MSSTRRRDEIVRVIRGASVSDQGGFIALELEGEQEEVERVLTYLREQGVKLPKPGQPIGRNVNATQQIEPHHGAGVTQLPVKSAALDRRR